MECSHAWLVIDDLTLKNDDKFIPYATKRLKVLCFITYVEYLRFFHSNKTFLEYTLMI